MPCPCGGCAVCGVGGGRWREMWSFGRVNDVVPTKGCFKTGISNNKVGIRRRKNENNNEN